MQRSRKFIGVAASVSLVCCLCLLCAVGLAEANQPEQPGEPVDWDLLPNGLLVVQYDQTGDGIPDYIELHQVTWSGWSAQPMAEIEAQAALDGEKVFIVEYDQDRYVYLAKATPLFFSDKPHQNGRWTARSASADCAICAE